MSIPLTTRHDAARWRLSPGALSSVIAAHVAVIASLWPSRGSPPPRPPATLSARLLAPAVADAPPLPAPAAAAKPRQPERVRAQPVLTAKPAPSPVPETAAAEPAAAVPADPSPPAASTTAGAPPAAAAPPASAPRFDADYLDNPAPTYPALSRRAREQGQVVLRVHVSASGTPDDIELRSSSGFPRLDQAALDAVRRWQFVPARRGSDTVAAWVLVPISFSLKS